MRCCSSRCIIWMYHHRRQKICHVTLACPCTPAKPHPTAQHGCRNLSGKCLQELKRPARGLASGLAASRLGSFSFTAATGAGVSSFFGAGASIDPGSTAC